MDRKKRIYIQYAVIFVLIMVFGITNFVIKTSDVWRKSWPAYKYENISPKEMMDIMSRNNELIIVDTRIKEDFSQGHIKGAINLPYTNFKKMSKVLMAERGKEIFVYSEDGEKAKTICEFLSSLGFSKVRNIDGGIAGWKNSGGEDVK
jgi:rhodanese-related sulfurtransferase